VLSSLKAESTEENPIVTFSIPGQKGQSGNQSMLQIDLIKADANSDAIEDQVVVSFNQGDQLRKLYFGQNDAVLYIPQGNKEYAIVVSEASGTMPLNMVVKKEGQYTLTVNETANSHLSTVNYLHLIDHLTGADIDLLQTSDYTFTAKPSDYASRFLLVFSVNENDNENENLPFAFVSNGDIVVRGEGMLKVMDLLGRVIMTRELIPHFAFLIPHSTLASGVYVLQLVSGDDLKTQKIVVR
jgi:hypothetical protein